MISNVLVSSVIQSPEGIALLESGVYVLPIVIPPIALGQLCVEVDEVAGKEEVVLRGDGEGIAHEGGRVDCQSSCEGSRDAIG
jgi:hypothetical protein